MAGPWTWTDPFSKRTTYQLELILTESGIDLDKHTTTYDWTLQARAIQGGHATTQWVEHRQSKDSKGKTVTKDVTHDPTYPWGVSIEGNSFSGYTALDFSSNDVVGIASGSQTLKHDADGTLKSAHADASLVIDDAHNVFGTALISKTFTGSNVAYKPDAPGAPYLNQNPTYSGVSLRVDSPKAWPAITGYNWRLFSSANIGVTTQIGAQDGVGAATNFQGLSYNTDYWVRVQAVNGAGAGPWSSLTQVHTAGSLPAAPGTPVLRADPTLSSVYPRVDVPTADPGVDVFQWQVANSETFGALFYDVQSNSQPSFDNLPWGSSVSIRVRGHNSFGWGPWSGTLTTKTLGSVPTAPSTATLWKDPTLTSIYPLGTADTSAYPAATGYDWQISDTATFSNIVATATGLSPTINGLLPNVTYWARYRTSNVLGASGWSAALQTTTLKIPPSQPAAPGQVQGSGDITTLTVQGTRPVTNGGTIAKYTWYIWRPGSQPQGVGVGDPLATIDSGLLRVTFSGLVPNTQYLIGYSATSENGASDVSPLLIVSTDALQIPDLGVAPSADGSSALISVSYGAARQPNSYRVKASWVGGAPGPDLQPTDYPTVPFTIEGLNPGSIYAWSIAAIFTEGGASTATYVSPYSATSTVTQTVPNLAVGTFFSGDYHDPGSILSYAWAGTANASVSTASGTVPLGWGIDAAVPTSVLLFRDMTARDGTAGARMVAKLDQAAAVAVGQKGASNAQRAAVVAGEPYWASGWVKADRVQPYIATVRWFNAAGAEISRTLPDVAQTAVALAGIWTRFVTSALAPAGAVAAEVWITDDNRVPSWVGFLGGEGYVVDDLMLTHSFQYDYFDGDTPDDETYDYGWAGTARSSASYRSLQRLGTADLLADPTALPTPSVPRAPVVLETTVPSVDIWRRIWTEVPASRISPWQTIVPTFTISTGDLAVRHVRIRIYENPDRLPYNVMNAADWISEQTVAYLPANTVLTLDGVTQRAWASVAGGLPIPADKLLYGTLGGPADWPELGCGIDYLFAFDVPVDSDLSLSALDVALTRRL
jgi:hypothetical protein